MLVFVIKDVMQKRKSEIWGFFFFFFFVFVLGDILFLCYVYCLAFYYGMATLKISLCFPVASAFECGLAGEQF